MDKKTTYIIVAIVFTCIIAAGAYLLVKIAPDFSAASSNGNSTTGTGTTGTVVTTDKNNKPTYRPDDKGEWHWSSSLKSWVWEYDDDDDEE